MAYTIYPFSAILGQEKLKKALILNLINPGIGGVLITGQKGTAKSTAVRALGELTHQKVITIPLSVTEDRLIGSVDMEQTIKSSRSVYLPGILAEADRQILYVDEINLLQDHLTDIILTTHSSKENRVEREGISAVNPCNFLLVGTMNPEEGRLRQHFLDRFGLCVEVVSENKPEQRLAIVKARMAYEEDPGRFAECFADKEAELRNKIETAKNLLSKIQVTEENRLYIVSKCIEANVQGHRADFCMEEAAKALTAWKGHHEIAVEDIDEAASYVLLHRIRNTEQPSEEEFQKEEENQRENQKEQEDHKEPSDSKREDAGASIHNSLQGRGREQNFAMGYSFKVADFGHSASRQTHKGVGKRTTAKSAGKMGRYVYSRQQKLTGDLALDATIRAAAPYQGSRNKKDLAIAIRESDIREKVRQRKYANLLVFVVDASGSIGASQRMTETKGAILSLLKDAYVKRDKVCLIAFRGNQARVLLPPTRSVDRGVRLLESMAVGGKTPLNHGIAKGMQVIRNELKKNPGILPYMVMITDGKGNVSMNNDLKPKQELMEISEKLRSFPYINTMVLDIEHKGVMSFGIAWEMALRMGASYQKIETLKRDAIIRAVERIR